MTTPEQTKENKRRLAYLRSLGYKTVPLDGSWGPWLENLWRKATTREKLYPVSVPGLIQRGLDTLTGNTTYRVEHPEGEVSPTRIKLKVKEAGISGALRDPRTLLTAFPLAIGSSLLIGNGPEIMQELDNVGASLLSSIRKTRSRIGNAISRFDDIEDREAAPVATPSTNRSTTSPAAPEPPEEKPNSTEKKSIRDLLWRRSNRPSSGRLSKLKPSRATVENWGIRVPLYTGVAAPIADLGFNVIGRAYTPDSIPYTMKFPTTRGRFAIERGIVGLIGDTYKEEITSNNSNNTPVTTDTTENNLYNLPSGFVPMVGYRPEDPNLVIVVNSSGQPDSTVTLQQDPDISRFKRNK